MWSFPANLRIQGKSSRILTQLVEAIKKSATPDFHAAARERIEKLTIAQKERLQRTAEQAADKGRVGESNPHYVCAEIGRAIEPDDIIVNEAVTRQSIPNMQIPRPRPGTMISNAGGGLGASGHLASNWRYRIGASFRSLATEAFISIIRRRCTPSPNSTRCPFLRWCSIILVGPP